MKNTTVYLVHLTEPVREMAFRAAREVFPRAQLVPAPSVEEAVRLPGQERQLLVAGEIGETGIGLAAQAVTAGELPRWAVVHIGQNPSDLVETVPPGECSVRLLARIFRSAVLHHELLQENLQLRGDLRTLARRFNHDLRTPLGCIDAACALFQEVAGTAGSPHTAEALAAIRRASAEIDSLLERVSLVLKATSEPLLTSPLAMGPIVQKVAAQLASAPERPAARIRQPAQWPDVRGVEKWIEFVWTSLIQNALRHGGRSGTIQLGWEPRGAELRFWVSSAGAVPPSLQPNLLRPFHLLHQQPSAGLGLSLVERIVTLHGGRCGYESTPDNRALFHFSLPAGPASSGGAAAVRPHTPTPTHPSSKRNPLPGDGLAIALTRGRPATKAAPFVTWPPRQVLPFCSNLAGRGRGAPALVFLLVIQVLVVGPGARGRALRLVLPRAGALRGAAAPRFVAAFLAGILVLGFPLVLARAAALGLAGAFARLGGRGRILRALGVLVLILVLILLGRIIRGHDVVLFFG